MKSKEAPKIEIDGRGIRDGEKTYTHPAYGTVELSRISCNPPMTLFGSDVKHGNFIALRINTAKKYSDGNHDFIHSDKQLVEVYLSGVQFGELLTSMNYGSGVPCTINRRETDFNIPAIIDESTPVSESRKALQIRIDRLMKNANDMIVKTENLLSQKTINKKELKEIQNNLYTIKLELNENISYVAKSFDEKMDITVSHAKGEVEAFISSTINKAGIKAINNGTVSVVIPYNEDYKHIEDQNG